MKQDIGKTLTVPIGKDPQGNEVPLNMRTNQHLLITGTTGSGKDTFLCSLIYLIMANNDPEAVKFILVDATRVVLSSFQDSKYLLAPVVTNMDATPGMFSWLLAETEHRFDELIKEKVRTIEEYNTKKGKIIFPRIFVLIRELTDLMLVDAAFTEKCIIKLTQLTKATGIHLILVSQRPSEYIFTGLIKANIPSRIAFFTLSSRDSIAILDKPGAEKLEGQGDMLLLTYDSVNPVRLKSTYIKENEIDRFVSTTKPSDYDAGLMSALVKPVAEIPEKDEFYDKAVNIVRTNKRASAPLLQRELQIGYARASRLLDEMEKLGIVGPINGTERKILN